MSGAVISAIDPPAGDSADRKLASTRAGARHRRDSLDHGVTHRHITHEHAAATVHGDSAYGRMNKWLALHITRFVGSMTCAYLFAGLALISLPSVIRQHDITALIAWIAQTFLQLVLLSIIIVGQQVLAEASDQRAAADHETIELLRQINVQQLDILEELRGVIGRLTSLS